MSTFWDQRGLYGVMARFNEPEELVAATERAYRAGYRKMDAYSPMPVEGLAEALGFHRTWVSPLVLMAGLSGCIGGFSLLYWITKIAYAHNIAGRPFNSWPMYIPIMFECTVLLAGLTSMIGMFALNGLPMPYHPVFNLESFVKHASRDKFFLCIEAVDPMFDLVRTKAFLKDLDPEEVAEVEK